MMSAFVVAFLRVTFDDVLNDGDRIGSIVGGTIATLGLLAVIISRLRSWLTWRKPISVYYLIPRREYAAATFPNNPEAEEYREDMTLAEGDHTVMFLVRSKVVAEIQDISLEFVGGENRPTVSGGKNNPFVVGTHMLTGRWQDWHGIWHEPGAGGELAPNAFHVEGFGVKAMGPFEGAARLRFKIRGRSFVVVDLPFRIEVAPDSTTPDSANSPNSPV